LPLIWSLMKNTLFDLTSWIFSFSSNTAVASGSENFPTTPTFEYTIYVNSLSSPALRSPMFQWIRRFAASILSGFVIPNLLYIFTIAGTRSMRVTFSTFFFAFSESVIFSANSSCFVLTWWTDFLTSIFVCASRLSPDSARMATIIIRNGKM